MPYTATSDDLPDSVKALDLPERERWIRAYNAAFKNAKSSSVGGESSDEDADKVARKMANTAIKATEDVEVVDASGPLDTKNPLGNGLYAGLFVEVKEFAEPPEWMPFMPVPGVHKHPRYGTVEITKPKNQLLVDNFRAAVYQEQIPVDGEHELKLSGAVGWVRDMRTNKDGSVDARVEWTERGKNLIKSGGYRYVSPEFWDNWTAPDTQKAHEMVAIGAAITTRPFFKEKSLRPLVASEAGYHIAGSSETFTQEQDKMSDDNKPDSKPSDDATTKRFTDLEAENATLKAFKETAEPQLVALKESLAKVQTDARTKRFTDEVMGRSDANDTRWIGPIEKHVATLGGLTTAFGEDSENVKDYIELQRETAKKMHTAGLFSEQGSDKGDTVKTAMSEIDTKAALLMSEGKAQTKAQAVEMVITSDKELAKRYTEERG